MYKVFISSTVYDLIDIRAEVEEHLTKLSITPVSSSNPLTEMKAIENQDSIQICLNNIKDCDEFLLILNLKIWSFTKTYRL